jgi:hypothetical protein
MLYEPKACPTLGQTTVIESQSCLNGAVVCIFDQDMSALQARSEIFSSAGWEVNAFSRPDTFLEYARVHFPQVAGVHFGGASGDGLEVAARLGKVSPSTSIIVCLRTHRGAARQMLPDRELINLIAGQYVANSPQLAPQPAVKWRYGGYESNLVN